MRNRWVHTIVLCGSIALGAAGCKDDKGSGGGGGGGGAAAVDTSTPKAAAMSFAKAVMAGDNAGIRASSVGTDEQYKIAETLGAMAKAVSAMSDAAKEKFGADNEISKKFADDMVLTKKVERSDVKEEGDTATLVDKERPDDQDPITPRKLKKVDGKWKVDLAKMEGAADMQKIAPGMTKAAGEMAADIKAGKFKDAKEAGAAFTVKVAAVLMPEGTPTLPTDGKGLPTLPK